MKRIAIIGSGISGLATAKTFLQRGHQDVTVYESGSSLGGVWAKERSYPGVSTQTTRDEYSFSDFKMPSSFLQWPTGEQILTYLQSYADHFQLNEKIMLNCKVLELKRQEPHWRLTLEKNGKHETVEYDFVVVCSGVFHKPYLPSYEGRDSFCAAGGKILHSSEVHDLELLKGKQVVVVGFAKSATDIATLSTGCAAKTTLLFRKAQWKIPRFFGNLVNMRLLLFSRFSEAFFNYHSKNLFEKILHTIGAPMVWLHWRSIELLLKFQFGLKKLKMIPSHAIEDQVSCSLSVEPVGFYDAIHEGKLKTIESTISHFTPGALVLSNGQEIPADVVVFGTGYSQELPYFDKTCQSILMDKSGKFKLYRNIVNPDIPALAFVGFNSSFFTTITSEVASHWVARYFEGKLQGLPTPGQMNAHIEKVLNWKERLRPIANEFGATCIAPFMFHHLDELMEDMGLKTRVGNPLLNFFKPIDPTDYATLLNEEKSVLEEESSVLIDACS